MQSCQGEGILTEVSGPTCLLNEYHDKALDQKIHPRAVLSMNQDNQHLESGTLMPFMRQMPNHSIYVSLICAFGFGFRV